MSFTPILNFFEASRALSQTQSTTSAKGNRSARLSATGVKRSSMYFNFVLGGILDRLRRDAVNDFRRTVEQAQGIELGEEILEIIGFLALHLHQCAQPHQAGRHRDGMLPGNVDQRAHAKGALQVAVQFHLGHGFDGQGFLSEEFFQLNLGREQLHLGRRLDSNGLEDELTQWTNAVFSSSLLAHLPALEAGSLPEPLPARQLPVGLVTG